jgi:hypothetical protein
MSDSHSTKLAKTLKTHYISRNSMYGLFMISFRNIKSWNMAKTFYSNGNITFINRDDIRRALVLCLSVGNLEGIKYILDIIDPGFILELELVHGKNDGSEYFMDMRIRLLIMWLNNARIDSFINNGYVNNRLFNIHWNLLMDGKSSGWDGKTTDGCFWSKQIEECIEWLFSLGPVIHHEEDPQIELLFELLEEKYQFYIDINIPKSKCDRVFDNIRSFIKKCICHK